MPDAGNLNVLLQLTSSERWKMSRERIWIGTSGDGFSPLITCDQSLENISRIIPQTGNPEVDKPAAKNREESEPKTIIQLRNEKLTRLVDVNPELLDFYNNFDKYTVHEEDKKKYEKFLKELSVEDKELLNSHQNIYELEIKNNGKLLMPVIMEVSYSDKSQEIIRLPAEIWRHHDDPVIKKLLITSKIISSIKLDPYLEIADTNKRNNVFPRPIEDIHLELDISKNEPKNEMQKQQDRDKKNSENKDK